MTDFPSELLTALSSRLGVLESDEPLPGDHGFVQAWLVKTSNGPVVTKRFRQPRAFQQSLHALKTWGLSGTPRLLASLPELQTLVMTAEEGTKVSTLLQQEQNIARCFEEAGRWCRRLHDADHQDTDPMPLEKALQRRVQRRLRQARLWLNQTEWNIVQERLLSTPEALHQPRCRCHLDFSPRNWLWSKEKGLRVLDFEHARPDLCWMDLAPLAECNWFGYEQPFFAGYGALSPSEQEALAWCTLFQALGTWIWGCRQKDEVYQKRGRQALDRILSDEQM